MSLIASIGGAIAGSLVSGLLANKGQSSANDANYFLSRQQMEYQKYFYQHRHQWEVADLRNAGLNPILSATGGSGGGMPSGQVIPAQNEMSGLAQSLQQGITTAVQLGQLANQLRQTDSQIALQQAQANQANAQAVTQTSVQALNNANAQTALQTLPLIRANTARSSAEARKSAAEASQAEVLKSVYGIANSFLQPILSSANQGAESVSNAVVNSVQNSAKSASESGAIMRGVMNFVEKISGAARKQNEFYEKQMRSSNPYYNYQ